MKSLQDQISIKFKQNIDTMWLIALEKDSWVTCVMIVGVRK